VLDLGLMRRLLILGLALILFCVGAGPLSACALFASKLAECATPEMQSRCDHMNMDDSATQVVAAPNTSCCSLSQAPVSDSQIKASGLALAALVAAPDPIVAAPRVQQLQPVLLLLQNLSPPSLQSLLCTFLI
jgi:hypothetical protein